MSIESDLIASLVRGYHFNEGSGINATNFATGGGYPATLTASDIWVPGILGASVIKGDGGASGGYATASDSNLPMGTDPCSLVCWWKSTFSGPYAAVILYGPDGTAYQCRGLTIGDAYSSGGAWVSSYSGDVPYPGGPYNDGDKHFMVGTFNGVTLGISVDNGAFTYGVVDTYTTPSELKIAHLNSVGNTPATVDEVLIFNRVITASEVSYLWNGGNGRELTSGKIRFPLPCRLPL